MSVLAFDTHTFVKRLKKVGFTEEQAEVFVEEQSKILEDRVATKADIVGLEQKISSSEETLRREISEAKIEMMKWAATLFLAQTALIIGAMFTFFKLFGSS
ncbi:MAG: DUF1640 domain-containing protein [Magnetococcales bacterium]|nr:DUF1640 domain-containing protein [Magnetococcales bacterium]